MIRISLVQPRISLVIVVQSCVCHVQLKISIGSAFLGLEQPWVRLVIVVQSWISLVHLEISLVQP